MSSPVRNDPSPGAGRATAGFGDLTAEQMRGLVDHLHAGLVIHGPDTRIRLCNATSAELLGLTTDQMLGKTALDPAWCFVGDDEQPLALEDYPVHVVLRTRQPARNLLIGVHRPQHAELLWVLCNADPQFDAEGAITQVVVTFIDVTDRRDAREQRRALETQLHFAQRMDSVGQLAAGVAHDFNNLLTAVLGTCDLIEMTSPTGETLERRVDEIRGAARRAATLTQQLLAFGRRQPRAPRRLDLRRLVEEVTPVLRRLLGPAHRLVLRLGDVGPVHADPAQLEQVLVNLLVNARDASPEGGPLHVTLDERAVDGAAQVVLSVRDEGIGMTPEDADRVYEPFFTTKAPGRGTGLGLATVYGIVQQSGGTIHLETAPGAGACFEVRLPRLEGAPPVADEAATPRTAPPRGSERILVLEDDDDVRTFARTALRTLGYAVVEAASVAEARERLSEREPPALLLSDVGLPDGTGPDLVRGLGAAHTGLRVVFMSGHPPDARPPDPGGRPTALLGKPFSVGALAGAVREALDAP